MSSFKKNGGRYGMHGGSGRFRNLQVDDNLFVGNQVITAANTPGFTYYVDRNHNGSGSSGNGSSWDEAFLTIGEAIAKVNSDYSAAGNSDSKGRNRVIYISEGWYGEVPLTLTANDVTIIGTAPGHHDSVVLYGSATAGGFDITSGGPALTITGSNNEIRNIGFFTYDVLYASVRNGANASDPDTPTASAPTGNAFINCSFIRDVDDGSLGGLDTMGGDGTLISGCEFHTSCKDWGIRVRTNGVGNPVQTVIEDCKFSGTPIALLNAATAEDTIFRNNVIIDDTSDRPGTVTVPISNTGGLNLIAYWNFWEFSEANAITGAGDHLMVENYQLAAT